MTPIADFMAWLATLPRWQTLAVIILASVLVARAVQVGGDAFIRALTTRIEGEVDDVALQTVHPALYLSALLAGAYFARAPLALDAALDADVAAVVLSALILVWMATLVRLGRRVSKTITAAESTTAERSVVPVFQNVWSAGIIALSSFALLRVWNYDVTPLLASAGILGIILGFAARDTIANFFGSIALYFDGTYKVGDYIVTEDGDRGRVEDVSIRSTTIRTRDDVLVTLPNSVLNSARVINESGPKRERRIRIPVGVAYDSDLDHVEATLLAVAAGESLVQERPSPRVRFREFGDSAIDTELLIWVADPVLRGRATHLLLKAVHAGLRDADIAIPFPQREVHIVGDHPFGPAADEGVTATVDADGGTDITGHDVPGAD
ncbi:mechanosensitive ion channel family protein [Haloglomus halophilum]|uniref:mechanosensitive ion channel family protein n=1 Tax=Haloglomus halophilum TaxID=2962672 RepID=UPI0020CA0440|nr:mechanosensitive ion channel family protein [Haloglomus halophilum]